MTKSWSVAKAKAQLSQVIAEAEEAAQVIENRGVEVVVVISVAKYRELVELAERAQPEARLRQFRAASRRVREAGGAELEIPARERRKSPFDHKKR